MIAPYTTGGGAAYGHQGASWGGGAPGGIPPPPSGLPPGAAQAVAEFCRASGLDGSAEKTLLEQPPDVQQWVMAEGSLTGSNKSAVLMSRIRRIVDQRHLPRSSGGSALFGNSLREQVEAFIRDNDLDDTASMALRDKPEPTLRRVLEEGPITGSKKSAILMGRLRRINQ